MEELRSTEILDKEIIADATKKAERISQKADEECAKISSSVSSRVSEEIQKSKENLSLKLKNFERDLNASVPLEKSRFYVSYIQKSLIENINEYLSKVADDKILDLLCKNFKKVDFNGFKLKAYFYGLDENLTENALKNLLGNQLVSVEKTEFNKMLYEDSVLENNKGIIIFSENSEIKCRFTLCQVIDNVLDRYRAELSDALFGSEELGA